VKAPAKKSSAVKKPAVTVKTSAKPTTKAKAPVKPVSKAASKTVAVAKKPLGKFASKPAAKSVGEAVAKPASKPAAKTSKPAAKPASKTVMKPVVKPASPASKSAPKSAPSSAKAKPVAKAPAKPVAKPVAKAPVKAPAKAAAKAAPAKPAAKPVAKPEAKAPVVAAKTVGKSQAIPLAPLPGQAAANLGKPVSLVVPTALTKPAKTSKSGFISPANIAPRSMEVSTAAKTNFTMSSPVLAPPPQIAVKKDAKLANNWKNRTAADLTDAEAIAMPDSEYMSALQLAFFRLKLVQLKKDILNSAGKTTEHLREDTTVVPDPADRATIEEEHALELRTRDRERKLLKKIEQSIVRIDAEDYGYCDETGEPIGIARLIARPTATLSIEAQQRRELKQKMFGD
jgi:DnaK suppressor protein